VNKQINFGQQNWVCEESWKPNLAQSIFFLGSALGSVVLGWLGDHKGRLPVLVGAGAKEIAF
jgi:MFS transporter, OCT family, solute carrier family 22 (organic cation transporter), member 4/5